MTDISTLQFFIASAEGAALGVLLSLAAFEGMARRQFALAARRQHFYRRTSPALRQPELV